MMTMTTITTTKMTTNKNQRKNRLLWLWYLLFGAGIIALDQISKYWAVNELRPVSTIPLIEDVFHLTYATNTGAAFSLLEGQIWFFLVITVLMIGLILWLLCTGKVRGILAQLCLVSVAAGGIGNAIDRAVQGYVVDMFDFRLINFAVFNVADIFVTCGGILFLLVVLFSKKDVLVWKP